MTTAKEDAVEALTVELDSYLPGTILADVDHDDWVKCPSGEWTHKEGPFLRSKTLAALFGPFTIVAVPIPEGVPVS